MKTISGAKRAINHGDAVLCRAVAVNIMNTLGSGLSVDRLAKLGNGAAPGFGD